MVPRLKLSKQEVDVILAVVQEIQEWDSSIDEIKQGEVDFAADLEHNVTKYSNISEKQVKWLGQIWKKVKNERHPGLAEIWKKAAAV